MRRIKGFIWFVNRYGILRYFEYNRMRKSGYEVDYSRIFSPEEFKILEENGLWPIPAAKLTEKKSK